MIPEGTEAIAVPADQTASIDWWRVLYLEMAGQKVPVIVTPMMAPGTIQVVQMKDGKLTIVNTITFERGMTP